MQARFARGPARSTLMPSLVRYGSDTGIADEQLRKRLLEIPLAFLEFETGLSRHTIVRARRGQSVHARSLQLLKNVVRRVPVQTDLRGWPLPATSHRQFLETQLAYRLNDKRCFVLPILPPLHR